MKKRYLHKRLVFCLTVLVLLCLSAVLSATDKDNFRIMSHSGSQIDLKFNLGDWNLETKTENGVEIKSVVCNSKNNLFIGETETLPIYTAMIAIPDGMDVELVTDVSRQQDIAVSNLRNRDAMEQGRGESDLYPMSQIVISEPGQFRDFRVATVNVYPFQLNAGNSNLKVIEEANISLRFVSSRGTYINPGAGYYSTYFDNLYDSLILNYRDVRDESVPTAQPKLLVIYGTSADATYLAKVDEYVNWKKQKGYIVNKASTATGEAGSSTTTIKAYILAQYNNLSTRPDVVTLIGDTGGVIAIPTFSAYVYDYGYQLLVGSDQFADVQIGRISVEATEHLTNYLAKIYAVERDIDVPTAQWLNRMLLVGDTASGSGISTIFTNQYIHEISEAVNPTYSYTEQYGTVNVSGMNAAITQGVAFFNYRGWMGMSGWGPGSTTNGLKLNHGVMITCATGSFDGGTSTTESYVRLGTEAMPSGGITAIGMATTSTHTGLNNCLNVGIFHGIFDLGMRSMGEALLYSKINTQNVYGVSAPSDASNFNGMCNLMGDPTAETFIGIPGTFNVTAPATIVSGTTTLQIVVKNASNVAVPNAAVNLWQTASSLNTTVYTDASGRAFFTLSSALTGSLTLTVSKHDFKPAQQTITINAGGGIVYYTSSITGGNGDGIINAGETINYRVSLRNSSAAPISVSGTITETDPYVNITSSNAITFGSIGVGATVQCVETLTIAIDPTCPDNHPITFTLNLGTNGTIPVQHIIRAADLDYVSHTVMGSNSYLEIGETANLYVSLINNSSVGATSVYGVLRSLMSGVTVTDSLKYFGNISSGASYSNSGSPFTVSASTVVMDGMIIPMELYLYNASGFSDTEPFTLTIGNTTVTDPLGQDAYGYYIFDVGDTGYSQQCPTYSWINVAPAEGGSGTALTISDAGSTGDEGDQVGCDALETVTLPFTFKFYGVNYNQITVCSNGFLAMGTTLNHEFRNWRLPGAGGPNAMIAPFWDDLCTLTGSGIYVYNDTANHKYIIEWYNLKNGRDRTSEETFQVILFDPLFYQTTTGDGPIKIQYKVFNNVDLTSGVYNHGNACTVGIKDHTGTRGLEYTYNNTYPTAAQPLANQKALYITTAPITPNEPYLWITNTTLLTSDGDGLAEPGETLDVRLTVSNWGNQPATGATATISESDPWINITGNTASFGTIAALGSAINTSGLNISVLNGCPNNYEATVTAVINCAGYSFTRNFTILLNAPTLAFGSVTIQDPSGNNNGRLDPGETVTITMPLNNTGGSPSVSGSSTMSCTTPGITVNTGTANFTAIATGGTAYLSFSITASSGMSIGTVVSLEFNATAGFYATNKTEATTVGIILENFETGNFNSYPWTFSDNANWTIDNTNSHEGTYSARSGYIGHNQSTTLQTIRVLTVGGNITFWYKVSSENNFDFLRFYVDGVQQGQWSGTAVTTWTQATYALTAGTRTLTWTYSKDGSVIGGSDAAWIDDIIFPPSTSPSVFNPPQNLTASASNLSVRMDWAAPVSGTPTGYKVYKNGGLLTTVTGLTYTDLAVSNGVTYGYYIKAAYISGDSDATDTVTATPNAIAPTNLTAITGNGFVNLSWSPAGGRQEHDRLTSSDRVISGYRIYRNSGFLANTTGTTYNDTSVVNETTYSYYVTTVYTSPAGESAASNTVEAMPTAIMPSFAILGSGTSVTDGVTPSPINIYYRSLHGQSVYTAAELNAAGVFGPINILQLGFYIVSVPDYALPNFIIRMKHTTASNVLNWQTATDMVTVYSNASYMPVAGGYEMLALSTPFTWNGIDNIVIDTAFSQVPAYTSSGTIQYSTVTNGYRYTLNDDSDQTNVFTGGAAITQRPNVKLAFPPSNIDSPVLTISSEPEGALLSWGAVTGATRYIVYASDNPFTGFVQIASVTLTEYTDITSNPYRFYNVVATNNPAARISGN
jgi:hypothetical protein